MRISPDGGYALSGFAHLHRLTGPVSDSATGQTV
ncbi:hypothetical protein SAMN05216502_103219 [Citrobacter amalonaticus]|nr:hypothetical protein SAMN05216502_103219 [Citrobacter amalonaticus]